MFFHDRRHFRKGELIYALADGFDDDERRRALDHFGSGCGVCWGRLEELEAMCSSSIRPDPVGSRTRVDARVITRPRRIAATRFVPTPPRGPRSGSAC